jgi:hypothetical protein
MRYYTKSLPDTPVLLSNGTRFTFNKYPDGRGYVATDNEYLIGEFAKLIERRVGGVAEITAEAHDLALKKNSSLNHSEKLSPRHQSPRLVNVQRSPAPPPQPSGKAVPVVERKGKLTLSAPLAAIRGSWKPIATKIP